MAAAMLNPYMQTALGTYAGPAAPIFNRNFQDFRQDFGGGDYQNRRPRNSYYGGSNSRSTPRRNNDRGRSQYSGGRSSNSGSGHRDTRNKRAAEESGENHGKRIKTSEPYDPEEPTREESDDDGNDLEDEDDAHVNSNDSEEEKSSKFGANAPSQDWKKDRDSHYCTVCEVDFSGSFLIHRRTKEHRKQRDKKFPRCRLCRKTFQGVKEFEEHGKSEEHRKKCETLQALKEKQLIHAALSDSEDEETALKRYIANQGVEQISDENAQPVGQFHVVPLKTFFCKLCQKFFSNYTDGREIHCQTPDHVQKLKEHNSAKEARAVERNNLKQNEKKEKLKNQVIEPKNDIDEALEEEENVKKSEGENENIVEEEENNNCEDETEEKGDEEEQEMAGEEDEGGDAGEDNEGEDGIEEAEGENGEELLENEEAVQ